LITGCYQQRLGQFWYSGPGLLDTSFVTIAEVLKQRGFATGYIGKVHYGASDQPGQHGFPLDHGFDRFYGFTSPTKHYLHHKKAYQTGNDMLFQGPMWIQHEQCDVDGFTTALFGQQACQFISENGKSHFFLMVSFNAVHNFTYQLPESYLKVKGLHGFEDLDPAAEDYWEWRARLSYPAHPEGREYYLGQLHFLDKEIGHIIQELQENGLEENTVIILVGDNGGSLVTYANNGHLKGGKYTLFEGGVRVPMIISWPLKYQTEQVTDNIVSIFDVFPTILGLSGIPIPGHLDGIDLNPLLTGKNTSLQHQRLFWDTQAECSVRSGNWKLLITKRIPNQRLQIVETPIGEFLYDLSLDPGEMKDLSNEYQDVVEQLKSMLEEWQSDVNHVGASEYGTD
jgi:arylsulfatase A-like enzyme